MTTELKPDQADQHVQLVPDVIAVPSSLPGGLDAKLGVHFGKCECFTIVTYKGDEAQAEVVPNGPHGSCVNVVELLRSNKVQAVAAHHMGLRPLQSCYRVGITPYTVQATTVREACEQLRDGKLHAMDAQDSCHGAEGHGHRAGHGHGEGHQHMAGRGGRTRQGRGGGRGCHTGTE